MDISLFKNLLELPLTIKEVDYHGSWQYGDSDPAIFFKTADKYIPIRKIKEELENVFLIDPDYYNYFKTKNQIHFEYFDCVYNDLPIVAFLSPESIQYLITNKIKIW